MCNVSCFIFDTFLKEVVVHTVLPDDSFIHIASKFLEDPGRIFSPIKSSCDALRILSILSVHVWILLSGTSTIPAVLSGHQRV